MHFCDGSIRFRTRRQHARRTELQKRRSQLKSVLLVQAVYSSHVL
jgi:hypothetical protein